MTDLYTRDGHLSDLTLERVLAGEIERSLVEEHLGSCEICRARLESLRADNERFVFNAPPVAQPSVRRLPFGYGTLVALAAVMLLFFNLPDQTAPEPGGPQWVEPAEYFRVKGGLNVEFFVKRDGAVSRAQDEGLVHPGDRLGFQVSTPVAGHLMIVGVDQSETPYLCFPQNNDGKSRSFGPSKEMTTLDQAVVLDEVLGHERFTAIFCERSFGFDTVSRQLSMAPKGGHSELRLNSGQCRQRVIRLKKTKREGP